ncbi:glycosyltransferase family 15 protein [Viridothelium virens]|uniref:Glycosyltransferase family 15 protein n=1 Tax=Viridothelium virens TaxID=1048519 RepID=A0A6A6HQ88_VIRVR|nr:glycosyltransferase family 15 protein [Viridothelium virens]
MAGSTRYMRYIIVAFVFIVFLIFLSSGSGGATKHLQSASEIIREQNSRWWGQQVANVGNQEEMASGQNAAHGQAEANEGKADSKATKEPATKGSFENEKEATTGGATTKWPGKSSPVKGKTGQASDTTSHSKIPELVETAQTERMNATFVTLARNSDVWEISRSIRQVEDRFNRRYHYDWVFLNDNDFDDQFIKVTTALVSGKTRYGKIASDHWSYPSFIDQEKAKEAREDYGRRKVIYGDSVSYRHMCRYESGFFFRHPLMMEYEWYWRVEPSIELFCDIGYDTFKFMADHGKKYSFVLSLYEYVETIPTLWDSVKKFIKAHPEHIAEDNSMSFLSDDGGNTYNHCHFWSNFEIGNLDWLRSDAYIDYFDTLDRDGGFFYERWGDAPVHSIAAGLTLNKSEIHFFNDIAYYHVPFTHCPTSEQDRIDLKCHCNPKDNFDWNGYSCESPHFFFRIYFLLSGIPLSRLVYCIAGCGGAISLASSSRLIPILYHSRHGAVFRRQWHREAQGYGQELRPDRRPPFFLPPSLEIKSRGLLEFSMHPSSASLSLVLLSNPTHPALTFLQGRYTKHHDSRIWASGANR